MTKAMEASIPILHICHKVQTWDHKIVWQDQLAFEPVVSLSTTMLNEVPSLKPPDLKEHFKVLTILIIEIHPVHFA